MSCLRLACGREQGKRAARRRDIMSTPNMPSASKPKVPGSGTEAYVMLSSLTVPRLPETTRREIFGIVEVKMVVSKVLLGHGAVKIRSSSTCNRLPSASNAQNIGQSE